MGERRLLLETLFQLQNLWLTESGFQPIGVAVICFSFKLLAKDVMGYPAFSAPASELR